MNYDTLIKTVSEISENPNIYKNGLSLNYELDIFSFRKMNEDLFYRTNKLDAEFKESDSFEVDIDGILVKFFKKNG